MASNLEKAMAGRFLASVASGVVSGDPLVLNSVVPAVALTSRDADVAGKASVETANACASYRFLVNASGAAIVPFAKIYHDESTAYAPDAGTPTSPLTNVSTSNVLFGFAGENASVADGSQGTIEVILAHPTP